MADSPTAAELAYPGLHRVPARPQLPTTVREREEIAADLARAGAETRYIDQAIRYRTGLAEQPPLPPPIVAPEPVAEPAPPAVAVPLPEPPATDDDRSLSDFLRRLVNQAEIAAPFAAPDGAAPEPLAALPASPPAAPDGPAAAADMEPPLALVPARAEARANPAARFLAWIGRRLGPAGESEHSARRATHPALVPVAIRSADDLRPAREVTLTPERAAAPLAAMEPVAAPAPVPALKPVAAKRIAAVAEQAGVVTSRPGPSRSLGVIAFTPASAALPAEAEPILRRAAAAGAEQHAMRVVGYAADTGLAVDRARAVALRLMGLGVRADHLQLAVGTEALDEARLYLSAGAEQ